MRPLSLYVPSVVTYEKFGTIQRRLAWPLHKDDTLSRSGRPTGLNIYCLFTVVSPEELQEYGVAVLKYEKPKAGYPTPINTVHVSSFPKPAPSQYMIHGIPHLRI